jgi:hypothetical protein
MIGQKVWLRENHEPHKQGMSYSDFAIGTGNQSSITRTARTSALAALILPVFSFYLLFAESRTEGSWLNLVPGTFFLDKNLSNGVGHLSAGISCHLA